jgi:hypothetical protein
MGIPTYKAIQSEVKVFGGFVPKTCWVAHVFELSGRKLRVAPNRIDTTIRKYPCPAEKQAAILEAVRKLQQREAQPDRSSL